MFTLRGGQEVNPVLRRGDGLKMHYPCVAYASAGTPHFVTHIAKAFEAEYRRGLKAGLAKAKGGGK